MARPLTTTAEERAVLAGLVDRIGYEVMPFKTAEEKVLAFVPTEVPLTITATGGKGMEPTLAASISLQEKGYSVAPHVPARMVSGPEELDQIVSRLEAAGITRLFVVAGDAEEPAGEFHHALDLLKALDDRGHHFENIGIGGYPKVMPSSRRAILTRHCVTKLPTRTASSPRSASVLMRSSAGAPRSNPRALSFPSTLGCPAQSVARSSCGSRRASAWGPPPAS